MIRFVLLLLLACAATPRRPTQVQAPPAEAWPYCAMECAKQDATFLGVILPDYSTPQFRCACAVKPAAAPEAMGWGPT